MKKCKIRLASNSVKSINVWRIVLSDFSKSLLAADFYFSSRLCNSIGSADQEDKHKSAYSKHTPIYSDVVKARRC